MIKVYGYSDDIVTIEKDNRCLSEVDCFNKDALVRFSDSTQIRVGYPKKDKGIWWIEVEEKGPAAQYLLKCDNEEASTYSDVFSIDAELDGYETVTRKYPPTPARPSPKSLGCEGCPVTNCDTSTYRGSRCMALRQANGADFDPRCNYEKLLHMEPKQMAEILAEQGKKCSSKEEYLVWLKSPAWENE